ncbi:MAG TPA: sn-glycerol-3-phosphate ABC transporter ATP-binding protein UgpC [Phycisphaerae bacterium]|nr:sn-glycerol-3-phosphate ABC transporter ATP-binding protein UgpC [Phycisphaerae bacterium]
MAQVLLDGVRKVYKGDTGDVVAVEDFNLTIRDREFVVLVGPSGCGKTTTLRMIAGLEEITQGSIAIGDKVVNHVPPKDRDIAMVFQNYALYPHMSVYKNMAFGLRLRRVPKVEIERRVREAARVLGIEALLDRKPKALSGGQRQRVAVGRAIVRQPAAFLFDEPLSNLDAKLRVEMRAELKKLHHRLATTMIYVTHDQIEAMTLADRVVVMNNGRIQQVAPPLRVYDYPANLFVAGFLGTPSMNFIKGRLEGSNGSVRFAVAGSDASVTMPPRLASRLRDHAGRDVVLGVRPEGIGHRSEGAIAGSGNVLPLVVRVVEPLGDEQIVHLEQLGAERPQQLIAKLDSHVKVSVEQRFEAHLNMEKVHVFDSESQQNVSLEQEHVASER